MSSLHEVTSPRVVKIHLVALFRMIASPSRATPFSTCRPFVIAVRHCSHCVTMLQRQTHRERQKGVSISSCETKNGEIHTQNETNKK